MDRFWRVGACCAALVSLSFAAFASLGVAGAADPASTTAAAKAVGWLKTQQQADGGFEHTTFAGFETPDAILAIAEQAQTGGTWSTAQALAAVQALHAGGGAGPTPLAAIDTFVHTPTFSAGQAAKVIDLVAAPLGLDATAFHPGTGAPVNLLTTLDPAGCAGNPANYGLFNQTLYGALAKKLACGAANPAVLATIRAAQRSDGGWNFSGDQDPATASDIDTTSLAIQAIVAGGASATDPAVTKALQFLAAQHQADGAWQSFGADDPNSTAVGTIAVTAAGYDATSSCWRDTAVPSAKGSAYGDPVAWIRSQQVTDGHVTSPNDSFGLNTFATSQSVEGLLRNWLPIAKASGASTCSTVSDTPPVTAPTSGLPAASVADAVVTAPNFTG
jgi:hypothetical protein